MARLYLQAGCLLVLLAACALAADVGKTTAGAQQYDGHDREEYDGPERDYDGHYHHKDEHYFQKTEAKTFYLQESSYDEVTDTFKFRCAKESDAADVCLHPAANYGEHRQYGSDDFLSDVAFVNDAAICSVTELAGSCPSIVPVEAECIPIQLNCTVGKAAKDCGCPYEEGFAFTSTGYSIYVDAKSCEEEYQAPEAKSGRRGLLAANYAAHNVTLFNGTAEIIATHIDYVKTSYGYKEVKGKVEFVVQFGNTLNEQRRSGARHGAKAGKAGAKAGHKARTAYNHYEDEEDSHYEAPYYGHEDRYYEAAHHDHHHGRDSYDSYPKNLVKGGNLKITLLEKQYY